MDEEFLNSRRPDSNDYVFIINTEESFQSTGVSIMSTVSDSKTGGRRQGCGVPGFRRPAISPPMPLIAEGLLPWFGASAILVLRIYEGFGRSTMGSKVSRRNFLQTSGTAVAFSRLAWSKEGKSPA